MKKLNLHNAGILDSLLGNTKGKVQLTREQAQDLEEFKNEIFTLYKKLNNAYKLYFQGAKLKSKNTEYITEKYKDENGNVKERKIEKNPSASKKIDFKGKWGFFLKDDKTSLVQAIHSLYAFLTKLDNLAYTIKEEQKAPEQNKRQEPEQTPEQNKKQEPEQTPEQNTPKQEPKK